jgi:hypothetical protein
MYGRDLIEKHITTALLFSENYVWHLIRLRVRKRFLLFYIIIEKYMCTVYIKTLKITNKVAYCRYNRCICCKLPLSYR